METKHLLIGGSLIAAMILAATYATGVKAADLGEIAGLDCGLSVHFASHW